MKSVPEPEARAVRPLKRSLKIPGALLLTLSVVTPASSVFVIVPGVLQQAGTGAFLSFCLAGVVGVAMAYVYAELSSAFPHTGGEYVMAGRTLGAFSGFMLLAVNGVGNVIAGATLSLGAAGYLRAVWPEAPPIPVAVVIVGAATLVGVLNIRLNAWVTGLFLALEVLALVVLVWLGLSHVSRSPADFVLHPVMLSGGVLTKAPVAMIGLAMALATYAFNGYGGAVYFGEEIHDAPRRVAPTILWALALTLLLELAPVTAVLMGAPDLTSLLGSRNPFNDFVTVLGGARLNAAVSLGVAIAIVNAVIVGILYTGRFFYSTGRDGVWGKTVDGLFTTVQPRFHSPWIATVFAGLANMAACFLPLNFLLVLNGTGIVVTYAGLCAAAVVGRRNGSTGHGPYRMPLYPLPPILGFLALVYVIYTNWLDAAVGRASLVATAAQMAVAAAYYQGVLRRRGDWVLRGPVD